MNNNIDDRGPGSPQFNFCQQIYMRDLGEIKGFCSKSCYLRPSFNLVINVMQLPGADSPYGTVPGAPLSDSKTFFGPSPMFGRKILRKFPKYHGPHAM